MNDYSRASWVGIVHKRIYTTRISNIIQPTQSSPQTYTCPPYDGDADCSPVGLLIMELLYGGRSRSRCFEYDPDDGVRVVG